MNLMGDHTDYNDGFVPARWRSTAGASSRAASGPTGARSGAVVGQLAGTRRRCRSTGRADPRRVEPRGAGSSPVRCGRSREHGRVRSRGADLGISVDGARRVRVCRRARRCRWRSRSRSPTSAGSRSSRVDAARLALDAEVAATGVPGGLMDQLAALFGRAGHALLIDCRTLAILRCAIAADDRGRSSCTAGCRARSSAASTRRGGPSARRSRRGSGSTRCATRPLDQVADDRARVTSSPRTRASSRRPTRCESGDLAALGPLLLESHASLRDDYEVSTPELDLLVELLGRERRRRCPAHRRRLRRVRRRARAAHPTPTTCWRGRSTALPRRRPGSRRRASSPRAVDGART